MHDVRTLSSRPSIWGARGRTCFFVLAIVFFAGQSLYFGAPGATRDIHAGVGAWLILVCLMLMLLATGGFLLSGRKCAICSTTRALAANRVAAQADRLSGRRSFRCIAVYVESIFDPVTLNEAIHIIGTLGVGAALISFAVRERRAHRDWLSGSPTA